MREGRGTGVREDERVLVSDSGHVSVYANVCVRV